VKATLYACLLTVGTAALLAQQPVDPKELLAKARELIVDRDEHLPNYVCVQTVSRYYFKPLHPRHPPAPCSQITALHNGNASPVKLYASDRLRFQLKVSRGMEIGTWASASQFSDRSIFELTGGGAYGTGTLGAFIGDIFGIGTYEFMGEDVRDSFVAYGYSVPVGASHYQVKSGSDWNTTGYSGVFWIDSKSKELRRLLVDAKEMPPETGGCEAATSVDYSDVKVGLGKFLLPLRSTMRMVMADGSETHSTAVYSGWREYHGEAVIRFDGGSTTAGVEAPAPAAAPFPAALSLSLALTSPIDTQTAAAGDIVTAKLRKPLRFGKRLLAPEGAMVEARIVQMQHWLAKPQYFKICLTLEKLETHGVATPLYAKLAHEAAPSTIHLPPAGQPDRVAVLVFPTDKSRYIVPAGYQTNWITVKPPLEERK